MTSLSPAYQQLPTQPWHKCPTLDFRHQRRNAAIRNSRTMGWLCKADPAHSASEWEEASSRLSQVVFLCCKIAAKHSCHIPATQTLMRRSLGESCCNALAFMEYLFWKTLNKASLSCTWCSYPRSRTARNDRWRKTTGCPLPQHPRRSHRCWFVLRRFDLINNGMARYISESAALITTMWLTLA